VKTEHDSEAPRYTCPMHPEVQEDQPGNCPKCGMQLEAREAGHQGDAHEHQDAGRKHNQRDEVRERGAPTPGAHNEMVRKMRAPWLWTNFTVIALGVWLTTSPATFGYGNLAQLGERVARITVERSLPSLAFRTAALAWSDFLSGVLLVLFGVLSLCPHPRTDFFGRWGVCFVGMWLQFAPLVFWSPSPTIYANDTLIGALVITLSVLVPMMPGMAHHMAMMKPGPEIPPGWTYNPSSWLQRGPIIALGLIGWFISRYLAAYQLGYISTAWDPLFGEGTRTILDSKVSRSWPISDAGLGAVAYTFEVLMGFMGGINRWRTMPWMVSFFGILVVPLGLTSIILVILQPVAVGTWCSLCLFTALAMLIMIPLTVDEVVATCQFLVQAHREGKPFWRTFWVGDTVEGGARDARTPHYSTRLAEAASAMAWGATLPWRLLVSAALGLWLMTAPAVFGTGGVAADSDHLVGALTVTVAVITMAEVVRAGRFLNVVFGIWLIVAPWLISGASADARVNDMITGVAVILLSFGRGTVDERYGTWDRYIV